jgi:hypothetical protein
LYPEEWRSSFIGGVRAVVGGARRQQKEGKIERCRREFIAVARMRSSAAVGARRDCEEAAVAAPRHDLRWRRPPSRRASSADPHGGRKSAELADLLPVVVAELGRRRTRSKGAESPSTESTCARRGAC